MGASAYAYEWERERASYVRACACGRACVCACVCVRDCACVCASDVPSAILIRAVVCNDSGAPRCIVLPVCRSCPVPLPLLLPPSPQPTTRDTARYDVYTRPPTGRRTPMCYVCCCCCFDRCRCCWTPHEMTRTPVRGHCQ